MRNDEFTPTTSQVQNGFAMYQLHANNDGDGYEEFGRWLADHDRQVSEEARREVIENVRWLAEARAEYLHGLDLSSVSNYFAALGQEQALWDNVTTARHLADILDGANDGAGWLPSWKWDDWADRIRPLVPAVTPTESNPTPKGTDQ